MNKLEEDVCPWYYARFHRDNVNNKDQKPSCLQKQLVSFYANGRDTKNQRDLADDTHFAFLKGKCLNCYIGVIDF